MSSNPTAVPRVSFTGLECAILGTFYEESIDGTSVLNFGHDVDNFYATSTYPVSYTHLTLPTIYSV